MGEDIITQQPSAKAQLQVSETHNGELRNAGIAIFNLANPAIYWSLHPSVAPDNAKTHCLLVFVLLSWWIGECCLIDGKGSKITIWENL